MSKKIAFILSLILLLPIFPLYGRGENYQIRVGVLDTGILSGHIGLREIEIESGENFVFPGSATTDLIGHGTRIAGLIAKECTDVTLVPMVLVSHYPSGLQKSCSAEEIAKAIIKAIDEYNCKVLNISLGFKEDSEELYKAIEHAEEKGVVVIAAAGNNKETNPDVKYYPAAYDTVIAVSAVDKDGQIAAFSQSDYSVVSALGVEVPVLSFGFSLVPPKASGTSYAAATVTGWVSRLLLDNIDWEPAQIRESLENQQNSMFAEYLLSTSITCLN